MNELLFTFFSEISYIVENKDTVGELKQYYLNAQKVFNDKKYSDINVQDEEGNTFFHLCARENNEEWCYKLISAGANPLIINSKNKNGFAMFKGGSFYNKYLKNYKKTDHVYTNYGFHPELEQLIFEDWLRLEYNELKSFTEVKLFLEKNNMYSDIYATQVLAKSRLAPTKEYLNNFDNAELNSLYITLKCQFSPGKFDFENFKKRDLIINKNVEYLLHEMCRIYECGDREILPQLLTLTNIALDAGLNLNNINPKGEVPKYLFKEVLLRQLKEMPETRKIKI